MPNPQRLSTLLTLGIAAALALSDASGKPALQWSQGDPTPEEQQAMEWLNASRADPPATLAGILGLGGTDPVVSGFLLAAAPVAADDLVAWARAGMATALADSTAYPGSEAISQEPLAFYPLFQQEALALAAGAVPPAISFPALRPPPTYVYPVPIFGGTLLSGPSAVITGPNATGGSAAFGPYGANPIEVSHANLYAASITPREWMLTSLTASYPSGTWSPPPDFLLQGDSLPGLALGHTRMAGIAIVPGPDGGRVLTLAKASSEFLTGSDLPFGPANTVFITGVAYQDGNSNGRYDPGEGIPGISVTPDRGDWYAVTSASGGYAIPVPANSGTFALTATGSGGRSATASVTVAAGSVKADWSWPAAAALLPPQVSVPPSDGSSQITGFSGRGLVQTGAGELIGGFTISGPPGSSKSLLIRGVGPSLPTVGFPAAACIPATRIEVYSGSTVIAGNQGWASAADGGAAALRSAVQVGAFPLVNWSGGGGDSALVAALPPGNYSAVLSPATGTAAPFQTGRVGLVEVYDLSPGDGSRLVNVSERGLAGADYQRMIAGCTVGGTGHRRLLVRASGPSLATVFGLQGTLDSPSLTLFDSAGAALASNADWGGSPMAAQIAALASACGAFSWASDSGDAAIVTLAPPGSFTAVLGSAPSTAGSGLALIEVYETP